LVEARGVDDGEFEIAETPLSLPAIARDAGFVIDQRKLLPDQPVEQRRFSDIGPADDGNREGHKPIRAPYARIPQSCAAVLLRNQVYAACVHSSPEEYAPIVKVWRTSMR